MQQRILVAGGGITGLTAAYRLQQIARKAGLAPEIILVEAGRTLGGKVHTDIVDNMVVEAGPESFIRYKPWLTDLCKELDLPLVGTNPKIQQTYVAHGGELEAIPAGMHLMIPTKLWPFVTTRLLSPWGKLRAALEPFIPARKNYLDESIGHFVQRRFGREVLEGIAGPLLGGIYGGDWNQISLKTTFPQFMRMERDRGSLLLSALRDKAPKPSGSTFVAPPGGLQSVVSALIKASAGVRYLTDMPLRRLAPNSSGPGYIAELGDDGSIAVDAVVLALPAYATASLVKNYLPETASTLAGIKYSSSVVIALAFDRADISHPLDGSGFIVPRSEPLEIAACTWVSSKWTHAAPPHKVLLRCFLGRSGGKDWTQETDERILSVVGENLRQTMGIIAVPTFTRVFRWPNAMPQFAVGHMERMDEVDRSLNQRPGLEMAGAAFRGLGLPDCVREGTAAAQRVASFLGWQSVEASIKESLGTGGGREARR